LLILAALAAGALIWAVPWLYGHYELPALGYPVKGIDVSHHQGEIDWQALRAAGVGFAYIKATEGLSFRDPRFAENWRRSGEAGILRGAYHFFSLCKPGAEQAANFIAVTPLEPLSLPHALDVEQMEVCPDGQLIASPVQEIRSFLDTAKKRFGRRPLIYTTREFHLGEYLDKERFWLRSILSAPGFESGRWTLWQYHNRGRRPGISGPVDLDAFNGSAAEFQRFASP
jgi:lysozyme